MFVCEDQVPFYGILIQKKTVNSQGFTVHDVRGKIPVYLVSFTVFYSATFSSLHLGVHIRKVQLEKGVTSIAVRGQEQQFFVGTEAAQMYHLSCESFKAELISTSHSKAVKDVVIPL